MKLFYKILLTCVLGNLASANIYFWEAVRDGERSCCLFLNGSDICNPYQPCTRNAAYDLHGIFDYVNRLLSVEKGESFAYHQVLNQAQDFISQALASGMNMYYRYDEPARKVKFYHELAEITKSNTKTSKTSSATSETSKKQQHEEEVLAYLMKIGLAWPLHKPR